MSEERDWLTKAERGYAEEFAPDWLLNKANAEIKRLRDEVKARDAIMWQVRVELAALFEFGNDGHPSSLVAPLENPADAECILKAMSLLSSARPPEKEKP